MPANCGTATGKEVAVMHKSCVWRTLCLTLVALMLLTVVCFPLHIAADPGDLDVIERYEITITPRADATLDMTCRIVWRVLDSESEGPLTWVKIGIPNIEADGLQKQSACIDYLKRNGSYIEVYFKDSYRAGDTVDFTFSWHQAYMFTVGENDSIHFDYTPGWFDEICVERATVTWNGEGMLEHTVRGGVDATEGRTVVLNASELAHGERIGLTVSYPVSRFPDIDMGMDASHAPEENRMLVIVFSLLLVAFVLAAVISKYMDYRKYQDKDYWTGGYEDDTPFGGSPAYVHTTFGWRYRPHAHFGAPSHRPASKPRPHASGGHGGHGGCACACACACAGGGRAGCARKNILGTDITQLDVPLHRGHASHPGTTVSAEPEPPHPPAQQKKEWQQ